MRRATDRQPRNDQEMAVAREVWKKTMKDIELGRAGASMELCDIDMQEVLLVEVFGISEQRGDATQANVRGIHNFKANFVNECALMLQKLKYDGLDHMLCALRLIASVLPGDSTDPDIHIGKADFKSACKTLPADVMQQWLCWALVYNPKVRRLQVVPLWSQVFGSLGGVTAWFRTARALQHIMLMIFGIPLFLYVDDAFWASLGCLLPDGSTQAVWIGRVFKSVVTDLLGWELDAEKGYAGRALTLLGLDVRISRFSSLWALSRRKRAEWAASVKHVLETDCLEPGKASKFCGRFAFLNAHIFNRLGRALLRPLIWRQRQLRSSPKLTLRLRFALIWFLRILESELVRTISLSPAPPSQLVVLYSDAQGAGGVGAVAVFPNGDVHFLRGQVPRTEMRQLRRRKTQIVAFELLAALVALVTLCPNELKGCRIVHYIDNTAALACVVRGFSRQPDLADIAGRLWFEAFGPRDLLSC